MLVVIFSCWCSSFCCCSSIAFRHHPSPICVLSPEFLHPILYLEPTTSQSDSRHFHLLNRFVLATSATALSGHFLPTGIFYLTLFPNIFGTTCFYQGLPGSRQFSSLKFARFHIDFQNTDPAHLFVWFTVIHNPLYILNLYLCMSMLQKFLLVVKTLIKNIDQQPHYAAAMKI